MKLKVGDRVRHRALGKVGTVVCVGRPTSGDIAVQADDNAWGTDYSIGSKRYHGWVIEAQKWDLISRPCVQRIHITSDGATTVAVLQDGKRTVKRAEAKCAPSDTYDFATGARLAFDRLMGDKPKEDKPQYYNGKAVCTVSRSRNLTAGKVYEFVDGLSKYDDGTRFPLSFGPIHSLDELNGGMWTFIPLVEDKPAYKEVKRPAKVGEFVKATHECGGPINIGFIMQVARVFDSGSVAGHDGWYMDQPNYVVLEGYAPEVSK